MSKAEERAKELFPLLETDKIGNNPYITYNTKQLAKREGYVNGYNQAGKDMELTWEDIKVIEKLLGFDNIIESPKEFYQEVLKRFKAKRNE